MTGAAPAATRPRGFITQRSSVLTPRQQELLALVKDRFGGVMDGTRANYATLAAAMGWTDNSSVLNTLHVLRSKGALESVGRSLTRPEGWVVPQAQAIDAAAEGERTP